MKGNGMADPTDTPDVPPEATHGTDERYQPSATTSPEVEPEPREPEEVDVVVGDRIKTYKGTEVVRERDFNPDAPTEEHPAAKPETPQPTREASTEEGQNQ